MHLTDVNYEMQIFYINKVMDYYEKHYRSYFESTIKIDPTLFLSPLNNKLLPGMRVLDLGCGAGRDLKWFADRGMQVVGFEYSRSLARLARIFSGSEVIEGDFFTYDFSSHSFDAIVSIGSLVHVKRASLPAVLQSICHALVDGGLMLVTLKEGVGTSELADGRTFTLWRENDIVDIFSCCTLEVIDFSRQVSNIRSNDIWLGYVLKYKNNNFEIY